jgi:fatty-acyl-CoA synthase
MQDLASLLEVPARLGQRALIEARSAMYCVRAGVLGGDPPHRAFAAFRALNRLGQLGSAITIAALRHGDRVGIVDELGSLTFRELDERSSALACALRGRGVGDADTVGILCRNHRGFLDATFAAGKLGARTLYLNTDFAGPQLADVCRREGVSLLIHDEEYEDLVSEVEPSKGTLLAWTDGAAGSGTIEALIAEHAGEAPPPPGQPGRVVLLTSGTTGTPKGAGRHQGMSLHPIGALLSKVPYRSRESTYMAVPMFHALGFTQTVLALILGSTVITERRFKPERVLDAIARERPTSLVLVPVMLQRIVAELESAEAAELESAEAAELESAEAGRWDTSSLRIVFLSGSQLEAELVRRAQRTIGDKLYNFYGSTEVAWATFATPDDLRAAPGTAGRPPFATIVALYDDAGRRVRGAGEVGRIFVGNGFQFEGYTGGGGKELIDGLMSTGDIGHFDAEGRLFIDGREDDMIVSGGENLFPGEVEELLITHEAIEEAAVVGVDDEEFGQRLAAFVVAKPGQAPTEDEVKEFVKRNLARYKVPRDVSFVSELPRTPTGKVLKRELRERAAAGS